MTEIGPALERALDFTRTGPLILISGGYATPIAEWLRPRRPRRGETATPLLIGFLDHDRAGG